MAWFRGTFRQRQVAQAAETPLFDRREYQPSQSDCDNRFFGMGSFQRQVFTSFFILMERLITEIR